ncbi:MAG TPA: FMN-binding negative transcriptional regulator [Chitinophagaceae bacterium]|nr:FMN-binding negative transcriptional regulator [Chitinophagaceae bacterium]
MYDLPDYTEKDIEKIWLFLKRHPFATLIGCADDTPVATQVPLLLEVQNDKTILTGHIMRNTDHHKAFEKNKTVLCLFSGAHSYVSASWYKNPEMASTWNYMSVQARGTLEFLPDASLIAILRHTTNLFENNPDSPAAFDKLSGKYVQRLAKAIVGFQIVITDLRTTFKLSQNHDTESYKNIIGQLTKGDANAQTIATEMEQRRESLFGTA